MALDTTARNIATVALKKGGGGGGGGVTNHAQLSGRDNPEQHPISSITGLQEEINKIATLEETIGTLNSKLEARLAGSV